MSACGCKSLRAIGECNANRNVRLQALYLSVGCREHLLNLPPISDCGHHVTDQDVYRQ